MPTNVDSFATDVANAVRAELARKHKNLIDIAPVINLSRATVYRRFDGSEPFDVKELEKIASFLGIEVQDIFDSAELGRKIALRGEDAVAKAA